ncbi:MAG TPA: hypothetical protein VKV80_06365 [Streptosporangiaceae bacterium]|jgi:hypothetical protein|nr:hypothetical protein [Streptosporangiaceae bacterium]
MALKPEVSIGVGIGTAALVWSVYQTHLPTIADVRGAPAGNATVDSQRKVATAEAVGIVAAISLLSRDPTVFVIGGMMVIALDWSHRHANAVDHVTNRMPSVTGDTGSVPASS